MNTESISAIVVDDEESARNVLSNLLNRFCPHISVIASFDNLLDAVEGIKKLQPKVVFLDIEMPNYRGIEIIDYFEHISFQIVFTTAYDQYAIKAFEISAFDYLLKPIAKKRLIETGQRLSDHVELENLRERLQLLSDNLNTEKTEKIIVTDKGYKRILNVSDIIAIEAQEAYSRIYVKGKSSILVSNHLKHYEDYLKNDPDFFRSHKSWMINTSHVVNYSKSKLEIQLTDDLTVKLSRYRCKEFEVVLRENNG